MVAGCGLWWLVVVVEVASCSWLWLLVECDGLRWLVVAGGDL